MAKLTAQEFLTVVKRSRLIDERRLKTALLLCQQQHDGKLPSDALAIARALIEAQLITPWHWSKLRLKRYKGFFLGQYKLLSHLGKGGMSSVYLAEHIHMHRRVAVKVLPKGRMEDPAYVARFYQEAKAAAALDHPNIVRAYDVNNEGKTHYLVMEFIPGRNLQQVVREAEQPLDYDQAVEYVVQVARALQHAHRAGVIHRDIKPANVLLDGEGTVKVLDMGLALFANEDASSLTLANEENVLGTADYLSPEQAVSSHDVDKRADIYSLGCTLYFLIVGHPPFPEGSLAERIARHQTVEPPNMRSFRADCPESLDVICSRMMAKKPDQRYQNADDLIDVLDDWLAAWRTTGGVIAPPRPSDSAEKVETAVVGEPLADADSAPPTGGGQPSNVEAENISRNATVKEEAATPENGLDRDSGNKDGESQNGVAFKPNVIDLSFIDEGDTSAADRRIDSDIFPDAIVSDTSGSVSFSRRRTRRQRLRVPLWLWIGIGVAGFVAIGLLVYVLHVNGLI